MQGPISDWTKNIVKEYEANFPYAKILLSTWSNENIDDITCETIQVNPPDPTQPFRSNVNHQKVGALAGLNKMQCEIIMKCRPDQFIHNKNIFKIYEKSCPKNKIMIPNYLTLESIDYFASDFCQIATKETLVDYWNSIKDYDGSFQMIHPEIYLASNYILRGKHDPSPWKSCLKKYYYVKDYQSGFQIEWKKLTELVQHKKRSFEELYPLCVKPEK